MTIRKKWNAEDVKVLMLKHYPTEQTSYHQGMHYTYCRCGKFLDYPEHYPAHVDEVLKKTRGSK